MYENEIAKIIIDASLKVHKALGAGLLESVYEEVLTYELKSRGLEVERQKNMPVFYKGIKMKVGFRTDLIVNDKVIIELKSVKELTPLMFKVTTNYLKLSNKKLALLINFNVVLIKDGIKRIVNNL
ncbi:MAG TPA: GxxExxY protein [Saprospiraceae bacterium]|nr:GxxExxY protein [Saprospiraceae bacterium]